MKRLAWIAVLTLVVAATAAAAPRLVNYQGYLTDGSGSPVPDGDYDLHIGIYVDSVGGLPVWDEFPTVTVNDGVFHVILGALNPLGESVFEMEPLWLGLKVGLDPQIAPRTKITSVPWALRAAVADSALAVPALPADGDWTINGDDMYSAVPGRVGVGTALPATDFHVVGSDTLGTLMIAPGTTVNENSKLFLAEDDDGTFGMEWRYNGATNEIGLWGKSGTSEYGPHVKFERNTGSPVFSGTGNTAITLPQGGVSAAEMFDEPGIACSTWNGSSQLIYLSPHTLMSRSITVPAAGYVMVVGTIWVQWAIGGTSGVDCDFAIADQNDSMPDMYFSVTRPGYSPIGTYDEPVTLQGVFPATGAGTHTFYLLAEQQLGTFRAYDRQLTLAYFPTAYGIVNPQPVTAAAGPEVGAERSATEAANAARLEREVEALRAEVEALRSAVEAD